MKEPDRPILHLKSRELVPAEEDRRVDLGEFHVLLPCRDYEVEYKVAELGKVTGKTAAETISAMLAVFGRIDPHLRRSITFDNDTAFAQHSLLRTMRDMTTWFCDAYASWQKGGVENANGRLRRWLPRHLDIDRTSD
jgi:transposase, IS30 family